MTSARNSGDNVAVKVALAYLFRKIKSRTPDELHEHIRADKPLLEGLDDADWSQWRELAIRWRIRDITMETILNAFRKKRLDLLIVIMNTPNGMAWLEGQVKILRSKLGLE